MEKIIETPDERRKRLNRERAVRYRTKMLTNENTREKYLAYLYQLRVKKNLQLKAAEAEALKRRQEKEAAKRQESGLVDASPNALLHEKILQFYADAVYDFSQFVQEQYKIFNKGSTLISNHCTPYPESYLNDHTGLKNEVGSDISGSENLNNDPLRGKTKKDDVFTCKQKGELVYARNDEPSNSLLKVVVKCDEKDGNFKRLCCYCNRISSSDRHFMDHLDKFHYRDLTIMEKIMEDPNKFLNFYNAYKKKKETTTQNKCVCVKCGLVLLCDELIITHAEAKHPENSKVNKHLTNITLKCPLCVQILSLASFTKHMKVKHKANKTREEVMDNIQCVDCNLEYSNEEALLHHYSNWNNKIPKFSSIDEVYKVIVEKSLEQKKKSRKLEIQPIDNFVFQCNTCQFTSKVKHHILNHYLLVHMKPFECSMNCPFCDFIGSADMTLSAHLFKKHPESITNKLVCHKCGYMAIKQGTFKAHVRSHSQRYNCEYCDYSTPLKTSIDVHRRIHTKERPYKCDVEGCTYSSVCKISVTKHKFTHDKEKYLQVCEICKFKSVDKYIMNTHMKFHESGSCFYSCPLCPFKTNNKGNFKSHATVHNPAKQCSLCEFTTKYNQTMNRHMKFKHGDIIDKRGSYNKQK